MSWSRDGGTRPRSVCADKAHLLVVHLLLHWSVPHLMVGRPSPFPSLGLVWAPGRGGIPQRFRVFAFPAFWMLTWACWLWDHKDGHTSFFRFAEKSDAAIWRDGLMESCTSLLFSWVDPPLYTPSQTPSLSQPRRPLHSMTWWGHQCHVTYLSHVVTCWYVTFITCEAFTLMGYLTCSQCGDKICHSFNNKCFDFRLRKVGQTWRQE